MKLCYYSDICSAISCCYCGSSSGQYCATAGAVYTGNSHRLVLQEKEVEVDQEKKR